MTEPTAAQTAALIEFNLAAAQTVALLEMIAAASDKASAALERVVDAQQCLKQ